MCGKTSLVPTWREMAALERSEETEVPQPPRSGWGGSQRLIFVGAMLVLSAAAAAAIVCWNRPAAPPQHPTPADIENASPGQTVGIFYWLVASGLDDGSRDKGYQEYQRKMDRYSGWLWVLAVMALSGVVLAGLGVARRCRAGSRAGIGD